MKIKKGLLKKLQNGQICINFINGYGHECHLLRKLLEVAAPDSSKKASGIAYSFGHYYYISYGEWFESSWERCKSYRVNKFFFKNSYKETN